MACFSDEGIGTESSRANVEFGGFPVSRTSLRPRRSPSPRQCDGRSRRCDQERGAGIERRATAGEPAPKHRKLWTRPGRTGASAVSMATQGWAHHLEVRRRDLWPIVPGRFQPGFLSSGGLQADSSVALTPALLVQCIVELTRGGLIVVPGGLREAVAHAKSDRVGTPARLANSPREDLLFRSPRPSLVKWKNGPSSNSPVGYSLASSRVRVPGWRRMRPP